MTKTRKYRNPNATPTIYFVAGRRKCVGMTSICPFCHELAHASDHISSDFAVAL